MSFRSAAWVPFRRPAFVAPTLLILVLGTSATTTVFTVVDAVLIKPLPYAEPAQLVAVYETRESNPGETSLVAPGRLADWNRLNRSFTVISASYAESVTDASGTEPERLAGRRVAPAFFSVFGVEPILGRTFSAEEERFGGPRAAVLSEPFWSRRYAKDPQALGRSLRIGNANYVIVGVMPPHFETAATDVWLPVQFSRGLLQARNARFLHGVGRLSAGISIEQARADLDRVQRELAVQFPKTDEGWTAALADLKGVRVGEHRSRLVLALCAVGLLWLIAITNVASLVLVDTRRRAHELAMRRALGATRARIAALVTHDLLLLALIGAVLGTVATYWAVQYVKATFATMPRINEVGVDWRALLFSAGSSTVAALVCGLVPALSATRAAQVHDFSRGVRGVTDTRHRLQGSLVIVQVALSVLLCASALLLARSYANLTRVDVGFSPDRVVAFHVAARWDENRSRVGQLQEAIVTGLERLPDVEAVGIASFLPIGGAPWRHVVTVDGVSPAEPSETLTAGQRSVSAGYLRAIRVPLLAGDWCPPFRTTDGPRTVMANEVFARRFPQRERLIGQTLRMAETGATYMIVGILGNVAEDGAAVTASPYLYVCARPGDWPDPEYVVRAKDPTTFAHGLRPFVRGIDPARAVFSLRSVAEVLASATDEPRISMGLTAAFAAAAMLLAGTGLYGLFALIVGERRREMGVRLALGAAPAQLARLVWSAAGRLLAVGMIAGFGLTAGAGQWLHSLLFGVSPWDGVTLVGTMLTLGAISAIALAVPALRAARVAPAEALRAE